MSKGLSRECRRESERARDGERQRGREKECQCDR